MLVLQNEVHGVALLSFWQVLAFIDIEQLHLLQQFLLALAGNLLNLLKLHALVNQQGKVAAHGWILRNLVILHFVLANSFHHGSPIDVSIINIICDSGLFQKLTAHDTQLSQQFATTIFDSQSLREDIVSALLAHHHASRHTQSGEDVLHIGVQLVERAVFIGVNPTAFHTLASHPKCKVHLLGIGFDGSLVGFFLLIIMIAVAKLEELQVGVLAVGIAHDALQTSEEQCLTHHAKVGRKRIHHPHRLLQRIGFGQSVIVSHLAQRVVQYLVEAASHQLLTHQVLKLVLLVLLTLNGQRALQLGGNLHIIISIDAKNVFNHIARTLNVNAIGRHLEHQPLFVLIKNLHL